MHNVGWVVRRKTGGGTGDGYNRSVLPLLECTITFMRLRTSSNVHFNTITFIEYINMNVLYFGLLEYRVSQKKVSF